MNSNANIAVAYLTMMNDERGDGANYLEGEGVCVCVSVYQLCLQR